MLMATLHRSVALFDLDKTMERARKSFWSWRRDTEGFK